LRAGAIEELSVEQRREIAEWIDAHQAELPDSVRAFLSLHQRYLSGEGSLKKAFDAAMRELRRALHLTPSSEKRRRSGSPLAGMPPRATLLEEIEDQIARGKQLADWHRDLRRRHHRRVKRLKEKLAKMTVEKNDDVAPQAHVPERLEDIELTAEEMAETKAATARFIEHLRLGSGADPTMKSVNETLMPGGAVLESEEQVRLPAELPADLTEDHVVKTLTEQRVRYDFSVAVIRIELDVEKKVVVDQNGERRVIAASTFDYGPPRYPGHLGCARDAGDPRWTVRDALQPAQHAVLDPGEAVHRRRIEQDAALRGATLSADLPRAREGDRQRRHPGGR
jgi:hypothetical protein